MTDRREDNATYALSLMFLSMVFFVALDGTARWLAVTGMPVLQIVFVRYLGHLVVSLAWYWRREGPALLRAGRPGVQVLRAAALLGATVLNFAALAYLPLTITITVFFAVPMLVALLAGPLLGEKVGPERAFAIGAGFLGVVVTVQPWGATWHPAMLLSLGALCLAALYLLLTRMLAGVDGDGTQQIWAAGLGTIALLPFVPRLWNAPAGGADWSLVLLIGAFGAAAHILLTKAHRFAEASILAPMVYVQLVLAIIAEAAVFGTRPAPATLAGAAIIVVASLYLWRFERRAS